MAVAEIKTQCMCIKCGKTMLSDKFYTHKDGSKPNMCKACQTLHLDPFKEDTYLWLMKEYDVPYIPELWFDLRDKSIKKNPEKFNPGAIFGKYLSQMKLKQHMNECWADTERIQKERDEKRSAMGALLGEEREAYEADLQSKFEAGEISEAEFLTLSSMDSEYEREKAQRMASGRDEVGENNLYNENNFVSEDELPDLTSELTREDKIRLVGKWGRLYKLDELIALEIDYERMKKSFTIADADSENTLILLCKTNLKANQAIDCGDIDGYQKLSKVSESLRKTGKFTAAQNKEESSKFMDSASALVAYCEKHKGEIPKFEINVPQDIVDKVINDLKGFYKSLIYNDKTLAQQIEDYLKNRTIADEKKREKELGMLSKEMTDADWEAHIERIQNEIEADEEVFEGEDPVEEEEDES